MKSLLILRNIKTANRFSGIFSKKWKISESCIIQGSKKNTLSFVTVPIHRSKSFLLLILIFVFLYQDVESQNWSGRRPNISGNNWSVNVNSGLTSYYGDLSIYDSDFGKKLAYESGAALGFIFTKHYQNAFGVSAQLLMGKIKSTNGNVSISSDILEYNLHFRINFIGLFTPDNFDKIGLSGYAGIGNFLFKTTTTFFTEEDPQQTVNSTRVPEFVYFFGVGANYNITDKVGITFDASLRQCQNDKLDNYIAGGDYDYYSYISLGLTYSLKNSSNGPPRNKSKVARRSKRLKSLANR